MIYGVFSDVHSNLEALEAVLDYFERSGAEGYVCCGDMVGYGPEPNECLERIRALKGLTAVCGNHDLAAIGRMDLAWFNPYAREAALWTAGRLTPASREYLESLPGKVETRNFTVAHGAPRNPAEEYLMSAAQFKDNVPLVRVWPLFVGHSHLPLYFKSSAAIEEGVEAALFEDGRKVEVVREGPGVGPTALNPGSVGQPRDQDNRACCGLYDDEEGSFLIKRCEYDIGSVQGKIRAAGLPEFLALRLAFGQ